MTSPLLLLLLLVAFAVVHSPPTVHAHPDPTPTSHAHSNDEVYAFAYSVDAPDYENFQDRQEARLGEETRGRFRVALPDNRLQTVLYRADKKGYSAHISYDQHPDFPTLRAAIGPIGEAPEIGQSVLAAIRRGENWKSHKDHKDGRRHPHPEHGAQHASHGVLDNTVLPVVQPTTRRQRPSPPHPTRPRSGPSPSAKPARRRRPTTQRAASTGPLSPPPLRPVAQRLTASPPPSRRPATTTPSNNDPNSLLISPEDYEDPEILNRLIEAIRLKVAEEGPKTDDTSEDHSHEDEPHRRYSIGDKASVLSRLRAVVHAVHIAHHHTK
ncbi:uncharacterized protein [Panulirus ornatus]|uniref:uncharacterized protein n=1 Tax=Panulirus ornatus TaxID=150431 RepID=UPI003A85623B